MAKDIEFILNDLLTKEKKTIAIAESCSGGSAMSLITNTPGSSIYFLGGVVAYSNQAKIDLLKIPEKIMQEEGAVSRSCAVAMAKNIKNILRANIGLAITGITGPNGGTPAKPVGTVYIATTDDSKAMCKMFRFEGDRLQIKRKACVAALTMVNELIKKK